VAGSTVNGKSAGYSGDGGPATSAQLFQPTGVTADGSGNLFITDTYNQVIRMVDKSGVITTIAGSGSPVGFSGDGGFATTAQLYYPWGSAAVDPEGNIFFADQFSHRVRKLTPAPTFTTSSVDNGASFVPGSLVAGEIATIFGTSLTNATGINLASNLPLPTDLLKVSVLVNGLPAPLFAVDNVNGQQQINFQVPWEAAGQGSATLQVVNNGIQSAVINVPVIAAQPGVFAYNVGNDLFGAILHPSYQLADTGHPATAGETVLIYCTGLGAVSPAQQTGSAATGAAPTTATPTVMIGGATAQTSYSGLAPDFVGLYQINAEVPAGLSSGNQPVVITLAGVSSKAVLLPVQ
jgi:uncharacterized protein (TIGR03437 family)